MYRPVKANRGRSATAAPTACQRNSTNRVSARSTSSTSKSQTSNKQTRSQRTRPTAHRSPKRSPTAARSSPSSSIFVREAIFIIHCSRSSTASTHARSTTSFSSSSTSRRGKRGIIRRHTSLTMELTTIRAHPRHPQSPMHVPASLSAITNRKRCSGRPRKRVHFDTDPPSVFDSDSGSCSSSSSSSSSTWYSASEMDAFREVVREAGRKAHIHQLERLASRASARDDKSGGSDEDEKVEERTSRGLDYRSSLERQRNRLIAIRAVLECQRRLRSGKLPATCPSAVAANVSPDVHLALISAKCTRWARELASLIGRRDFYEAYPQFRSELVDDPIPDVSTLNCLKPFPTSLKKSISTGTVTTRRRVAQPIGSNSCPTPAILAATRIVEEADSDEEARRRLGIPMKRHCDRKRRREDGASSSCESSSGSEARSAAAVLAGC